MGMHPEMAKPTSQLARLVVVLFALVVIFPYFRGATPTPSKGFRSSWECCYPWDRARRSVTCWPAWS